MYAFNHIEILKAYSFDYLNNDMYIYINQSS